MYGLMAIHVSLIAVEIHRRTLLVTVQAASPESILSAGPCRTPTAIGSLELPQSDILVSFIDNIYNLL